MIWTVCDRVDKNGKRKIDAYIRGLDDVFPVRDTVYHYYVNNGYCKFKHWDEKIIATNARVYYNNTEYGS